MGVGTLTIYSASAGSGKTYQLAYIYLEKLFRSRLNYRKILAVTFTHKATAEMKGRILEELNKLSSGGDSKYLDDLVKSTGKSSAIIRKEAGEILYSILHDYSRFSVSTIDSFYQKIVRAFARDIGLYSGFDIEIDYTNILATAVGNMVSSAATDATIRNWLIMYARANIEEGRTWDLRKSITGLAGELFNEKFKLLPPEEKQKLQDKEFLKSYIKEMRLITSSFSTRLKELGRRCLGIVELYKLSDDLFYQKGKGLPLFIRSAARGEVKAPNSYVRAALGEPPRWSSGPPSSPLREAMGAGLEESVRELVGFHDHNIIFFKTANVILSYIYILGILSDVLSQVNLITRDENKFLLSDAGELIYRITRMDQTPFIYEKVGNAFENYMIDEFQDTSIIQWKNFRLLIDNSMAQGFENLVVGDIKQSIYRWRNSDWRTLRDLKKEVDGRRYISKPLHTNYRSCSNIIRFNNSLFSIIPVQIDAELSDNTQVTAFRELFSEAVQTDPGNKENGYVRLEFIDSTDESVWQEEVLKRLPRVVESVQDKGYSASDIGILVRDNKEGAAVLREMIGYSVVCPPGNREKYNYNIVSAESLLLANSPAVNFIIAVLRVLDNPGDLIARALMLRNYLLASGIEEAGQIALPGDEIIEYSARFFPEGYTNFLNGIRYNTLWNITEQTTGFFKLGNYSFNVAYLNSFQDIVIGYASASNPGITSFLEWWDTEGIKKSISVPEQNDSMKVLTIHKSKGLEFRIVILPFLSWNLDHKAFHSNILWASPDSPPFNKLGIVPVRYKSDLAETIFAEHYYEEKYSAYLDNINLLYVAFTRAADAIIGFAPAKPRNENRIASVIRDAISFRGSHPDGSDTFLHDHFDPESGIFEFGLLPDIQQKIFNPEGIRISNYPVNDNAGSLKLKLHWEDYFIAGRDVVRERIRYGKTMHEIFGDVQTSADIESAVRKKVLEGQLDKNEETLTIKKIKDLISQPDVNKWFEDGSIILNEASVLMPDASSRRPDRVIIREGKAEIVDFKFGDENPSHLTQVRNYMKTLASMGYDVAGGFIWYVDAGKIISA